MARAPMLQEVEALPEADRLEQFPHPRFTKDLYGHEGPESLLAEAFASGKMHHGWLITGPEGIGKATLAYRLARHVLAEPGERDPFGQSLAVDPATRAFRQVAALSHPGLLVIRRAWDAKAKRATASISIDEVRRLRSFLSHSADEGAWRIVIVDTADELNVNAANALLKSLEEPPKRTIFVLLSSEPGRLLATIRSRCRTLDLGPLSEEALKKAVTAAFAFGEADTPGAQDWTQLVELAGGSVRRALTIGSSGGLKLYERVHALVSLLPKVDWASTHQLGDELAGAAAEQKFEAFYDFLFALLHRLIRASATGRGTPDDVKLASRLIAPGRLPQWADAWEALQREKTETMALNLDRKALILRSGPVRGAGSRQMILRMMLSTNSAEATLHVDADHVGAGQHEADAEQDLEQPAAGTAMHGSPRANTGQSGVFSPTKQVPCLAATPVRCSWLTVNKALLFLGARPPFANPARPAPDTRSASRPARTASGETGQTFGRCG